MHQINTKLPLLKFCLGTSKNNFQLVDYWQTRGQSSRGLVNSRTGRFADWSTCRRQRICKHHKCQISHLKLSAGVQRGLCIQVLAVYAVSCSSRGI